MAYKEKGDSAGEFPIGGIKGVDETVKAAIQDAVREVAARSKGEPSQADHLSSYIGSVVSTPSLSGHAAKAANLVKSCGDLDEVMELGDILGQVGRIASARRLGVSVVDMNLVDDIKRMFEHPDLSQGNPQFKGLAEQVDASDAMLLRMMATIGGIEPNTVASTMLYTQERNGRQFTWTLGGDERKSTSVTADNIARCIKLAKTDEARGRGVTSLDIHMAAQIVGSAANVERDRTYVARGERRLCLGADRVGEMATVPHEFGTEEATAILYRPDDVLELAERAKRLVRAPAQASHQRRNPDHIVEFVLEKFPTIADTGGVGQLREQLTGIMLSDEKEMRRVAKMIARNIEEREYDIRNDTRR